MFEEGRYLVVAYDDRIGERFDRIALVAHLNKSHLSSGCWQMNKVPDVRLPGETIPIPVMSFHMSWNDSVWSMHNPIMPDCIEAVCYGPEFDYGDRRFCSCDRRPHKWRLGSGTIEPEGEPPKSIGFSGSFGVGTKITIEANVDDHATATIRYKQGTSTILIAHGNANSITPQYVDCITEDLTGRFITPTQALIDGWLAKADAKAVDVSDDHFYANDNEVYRKELEVAHTLENRLHPTDNDLRQTQYSRERVLGEKRQQAKTVEFGRRIPGFVDAAYDAICRTLCGHPFSNFVRGHRSYDDFVLSILSYASHEHTRALLSPDIIPKIGELAVAYSKLGQLRTKQTAEAKDDSVRAAEQDIAGLERQLSDARRRRRELIADAGKFKGRIRTTQQSHRIVLDRKLRELGFDPEAILRLKGTQLKQFTPPPPQSPDDTDMPC